MSLHAGEDGERFDSVCVKSRRGTPDEERTTARARLELELACYLSLASRWWTLMYVTLKSDDDVRTPSPPPPCCVRWLSLERFQRRLGRVVESERDPHGQSGTRLRCYYYYGSSIAGVNSSRSLPHHLLRSWLLSAHLPRLTFASLGVGRVRVRSSG